MLKFIFLFHSARTQSTSENEQTNSVEIGEIKNSIQNVYSSSVLKQAAGQSLMSFPNLQPYLEPIRTYIKRGYRTYLLLNPEMKLSQCLYKYLYMTYPLVRLFRIQNLRLVMKRLYYIVVKFVNSILSGNIFSSSESEADKERVGLKVAMITREQPKKLQKPSQLTNYGMESLSQSALNYNYNYLNYPGLATAYQPISTPNYVYQRSKRQAPQFYANQPQYSQYTTETKKTEIVRPQKQTVQPDQFVDNVQDFENMDSDARIDLSNPSLQYEADQLFNLDSMFWKTLGIEESSIKRYSIAYCFKEYTTDIFKRFLKNVLLK